MTPRVLAIAGTRVNKKAFTANAANNNRLSVPSGQTGVMSYDAAGNLTNDTYTGAGSRSYDAENRMTSAGSAGILPATYTYNADGQRVRRNVDGVETWQVHGMDGELLAEYAVNAAATAPQKEYGYRSGQLLITAEPAPASTTENVVWTNIAGVTATGNSLLKPGADGWYAGAASTQAIVAGLERSAIHRFGARFLAGSGLLKQRQSIQMSWYVTAAA